MRSQVYIQLSYRIGGGVINGLLKVSSLKGLEPQPKRILQEKTPRSRSAFLQSACTCCRARNKRPVHERLRTTTPEKCCWRRPWRRCARPPTPARLETPACCLRPPDPSRLSVAWSICVRVRACARVRACVRACVYVSISRSRARSLNSRALSLSLSHQAAAAPVDSRT